MIENMISVFIFISGAIVGSFLNVCIVRMPQEKSVIKPRSRCVHCNTSIPWYDNIPFLSYLLLRGQCRFCQKKISPRYFIVELVTAILFLTLHLYFGLTYLLLPYFMLTSGLIVATFVDLEHRIIPDEISLGGMIVGFILSFVIPELHGTSSHFLGIGRSLMGIVIGGGSIYVMGIIGDFIFKKESMGGGDVKLMGMIGAFLGWKLALLSFFIAPFFGSVFGIIEKIRTKESTIAYGPFLALGALMGLFWGDQIIAWISSGYGLYPL